MPLIDDKTFRKAIGNIAEWGDTDVFPFPFDNHIFHDDPDAMLKLLQGISKDFDAAMTSRTLLSHSALTPVGYTGFRWATQIDPVWNAYLLALTLKLAPAIEASRIPSAEQIVFSYRLKDDDDGLFVMDGWTNFQERTRHLASQYAYVVIADIGDFYPRIYHHRVENALQSIDNTGNLHKQIMLILSKLAGAASYGLPVGGPAARILSELTLDQVDRLMHAEGLVGAFCRYADDYRIFVNDLPTAYKVIGSLSEKLYRNQGLSLQKAKTRVMSSSEYLEVLDPTDPPEGSAAKFLKLHIHFDPYSDTAEADYEALRGQLEEFDVLDLLRTELKKGQIQPALTRRLVRALGLIEEESRKQAVISLLDLDNFQKLAPVLPQVLLAIRSCLDGLDEAFVESAHAIIRARIEENHYLAQVELNLAYMVRVLAGRKSPENEILLTRLFSSAHGYAQAPSPAIQRDIMLILAKWRVIYWLSDQRNYIEGLHAWVRRAFIVASYVLGDEGRHWRGDRTFEDYEKVVRDWASTKPKQWVIPI